MEDVTRLLKDVNEIGQELPLFRRRLAAIEASHIKVTWSRSGCLILSVGDRDVTLRHLTKMEKNNLMMTFPGIEYENETTV